MKKILSRFLPVFLIIISASCGGSDKGPLPGANRLNMYKSLIEGKTVGIVANQTSMAGQVHLVDLLISEGIRPAVIFSPEHGFRDLADAGEKVSDGKDPQTGVPLISLYGSHLKPTPDDLKGLDVVIYDIQDVGARFYTYISTLHYVLEACAENNVRCIVLDRPNPNGFYFDGNLSDTLHRTFVSMDPVPVVHGMTPGEYAGMLNGEGWLRNGVKCDLTVIPCDNYTHSSYYELPVKPSPNLPNQTAVYLYPSICFFEGTTLSLGRGTSFPFQVYGSPDLPDRGFSFTPDSVQGAKNPPLRGIKCYGKDLRNAIEDNLVPSPGLHLEWIIEAYTDFPDKDKFFTPYFDVLAAGPTLREQIQSGMSADEIKATWKEGLEKFGKIRSKYLLYN